MLLYVVGFVTIVCAFYIHLDLIGTYDINQLSIIKFSHLANSILKIVYGFLHGSCHKYMTNIIVNIIINIIMDEVHPWILNFHPLYINNVIKNLPKKILWNYFEIIFP